MARTKAASDLPVYRAKRDFTVTSEPSGAERSRGRGRNAPIFVVQKHAARRLHWDFRLEHGGVLWSWAVPKGPSADPADKRLAVHVEDHPLAYADFQGTIPAGQYGAGEVETWDRGTWEPKGDPEKGLADGELKFTLRGQRLNGGYVLVRLKPRPRERAENWLLIKEHDPDEQPGHDAGALEREKPLRKKRPAKDGGPASKAVARPAPGAVRGIVPETQKVQLASLAEEPQAGEGWLHEIKFDGYRLLLFKSGGDVRIMTRNGQDWTGRLHAIAQAVARLKPHDLVLDGELVALRADGVSSFPLLQQALSEHKTSRLLVYVFDLLQLDGWDLRPCRLDERKALLRDVDAWRGSLRYSDHHAGQGAAMRRQACAMGLEGVIAKRADAPYQAGRGTAWLKLKCRGREEFVVVGWTLPEGSRTGLGSLHLGYYDDAGSLQYAGGVGTGFSDRELAALRRRLDGLGAADPPAMLLSGDPPERGIRWVKPELVAEVQYAAWSGSGRVRHAVYLGLRMDKPPREVTRPPADPQAPRRPWPGAGVVGRIVRGPAVPPRRREAASRVAPPSRIVSNQGSHPGDHAVHLTHPDRQLWPGITKQDLADYWDAVADAALPEIANRPLAFVRCPDGIDGEHFFQKHPSPGFPAAIGAGEADGAPYLVLHDAEGLRACAQMAAIELHGWGATLDDPLHPDRMVFDLDPGEGVAFDEVVQAALDLRRRLEALELACFCRTTGGKGLHLVVPLRPAADWEAVKAFSRQFAEAQAGREPDRFVSVVSKARRRGKILIDWLRNGLGATAVMSFSPRARPGAGVATRLHWREVKAGLDPAAFNL
ncbi:MAG TPA: DNA ligase D, partial [Rhodopila sp.]|uniref:DNA ligase D n=1 Tax=Rhodopila sp. TaxID=2480087 RepID=UPI002BC0865C